VVILLLSEKSIIRKNVLKLRNSLSEKDICEKSNRIENRLLELDKFKKSKTVMCYLDFRNEVATRDFINLCYKASKRVAVPLVIRNDVRIIASEVKNFEKELRAGAFGILEPMSEYIREIDPSEIDFVVVPGVAFDMQKNRLGYGAGYYDRFLKGVRKDCFKVGIAFEFQICDRLSIDEHDIPMDALITENRIIV
jgi:5-formyltetrahydrofolate cyclo-ligase